ncbi:MAG TPA: hypothetical protein VNZ48_11555 [Xanthobacteraceae bacterium]|nr:hypothetical protein [Xanthobacteraceae bacterium]
MSWILGIFAALSFLSFQFDLFALAAISYVQLRIYVFDFIFMFDDFRRWQAAPSADVTTLVGDAWTLGVSLYFFCFVYLVALHRYYTLSGQEKNILRESARNARFSDPTFLYAFGIPPNIRNSARRVRTLLLGYLGNLVAVGPVFLFIMIGAVAAQLFWAVVSPYLMGWYDPARMPVAATGFVPFLLFNLVNPLLLGLFYFVLFVSFRYCGNRCLDISRRFLRVSLEQAQATDHRPPVLFLRSFRDDLVPLAAPKAGFVYKLFTYAERNKSLDQLLLEEGTALGPVVALGNPRDTVPPYGAARGYAQHRDWRRMVADLMEAASAIVICVDDTKNLWWEMEHVGENKYLSKSLLLLHPKYEGVDAASDLVGRIERLFGLSVGGSAPRLGNVMGVWLDETSVARVGLASHFSRAHYLLMLRWFLRSKMERNEHRVGAAAAAASTGSRLA